MNSQDIAAVRARWQTQGFGCDLWVDPPGQAWEDYVHSVDERVMVLEGEVAFEFQGKCFRPVIGEALLIPAGEKHTVRNIGRGTARWLYGYRNRS